MPKDHISKWEFSSGANLSGLFYFLSDFFNFISVPMTVFNILLWKNWVVSTLQLASMNGFCIGIWIPV